MDLQYRINRMTEPVRPLLVAIEVSPNAVRFSLAAKVGWSDMVHGAGVALRQLCPVAYPCLAGPKLDAATVLGGSDCGANVYLFLCPAQTSRSQGASKQRLQQLPQAVRSWTLCRGGPALQRHSPNLSDGRWSRRRTIWPDYTKGVKSAI